jgi:Carboxypeptidase regulatory-like domain
MTCLLGAVASMVRWIVFALLMTHLGSLADRILAYEAVEVSDGGTITGRVVFTGPLPHLSPLVITKDQDVCGTAASPQMLLVSAANQGVEDTVIAVEGLTKGKVPAADKPTLDNHKCTLVPRVQAVMVGTELEIQNSDPFLHTTRGRLPDFKQAFNLVFPRNTPAKEQRIRSPGVIVVTCDTHTHMRAYILAFEHPYFAVTDGDGRFQIDQVPAGSYTLRAWHEGWRTREYDQDGRPTYEEPYLMTREVRVMAGETSEVEFQLAARE